MSLFPLIENKAIDVMSLKLFAYGRALDHLPPNEIAMFAHKLSNEGSEGAWVALEVLFMYCFGDTTGQRWLGVKQLVRNLYLNGNLSLTDEPGRREFHTWEECARKLLKDSDDALALTLTKQLIAALASDLRTFELPNGVVRDLLSEYGAIAWPFFSEALLSRSGATSYRLANVLGIGFASRQEDKGGAIDLLESEVLVESIKDNRQLAAVVASMVSLLSNKGGILALTPMTEYLIEAFGNEDAVLGQIANNLFTGTWWGSRIPYYKDVASLFSRYISHPNANVRHWATRLELSLNTSIERDQASEDAHKVGRY